jgi:hypothetical protein
MLQIRNENIFEDEFLSSYIPDRLYNQITEPDNAPSTTMKWEHQLDL